MINFKCRTCGGEMSVTRTGDLTCSYCGKKAVFTDKDLRDYKEFRFRMLSYLSMISERPDPEETETIWRNAVSEKLILEDGRPLTINYLFKGIQEDVEIYTARRNVIFVFPERKKNEVANFMSMVSRLAYPSADIKDLSRFFPVAGGCFTLKDGRRLISVPKDEEIYPVSAFGSLPPEHTAWIVSRLENLCCVLAYSDISHGGIGMDSVYINARTHQAYLLGGWWNSSVENGGSRKDLVDLRETARRITGVMYKDSPEEFKRFVSGPPAGGAFEDFALWDQVIEKGFHGRKFVKLDLSNLKV